MDEKRGRRFGCPDWEMMMIKQRQIQGLVSGLLVCIAVFLAFAAVAVAESMAVPPESVDEQKIFWGTASKFDKPGSVDYFTLVTSTDDYKKAQRASKDSARYWIHINRANETAIRAIGDVGSDTDYDLIVLKGYLEKLEPPIETEDITELVLAKISN